MNGTSNERNGSFKGLRTRDLLLFDPAVHRHDRGWPHRPPSQADESRRQRTNKPPKRVWKTVGIFHFPHSEENEAVAEPGNADFC